MSVQFNTHRLMAMQEQFVRLQHEMLDAHEILTRMQLRAINLAHNTGLSGLELLQVVRLLSRQVDIAQAVLSFNTNAMRGLHPAAPPETTGGYRHLSRTISGARELVEVMSREAERLIRSEGGRDFFEGVARNGDTA